MAQKRGRPAIDDQALLKRIAALLVAAPAQTDRSAICKVAQGDDAAIRRLQRKWRIQKDDLLAAATAVREQEAARKAAAMHSDVGEIMTGRQAISASVRQISAILDTPGMQALAKACESARRVFSPEMLETARTLSKFQGQLNMVIGPNLGDLAARCSEMHRAFEPALRLSQIISPMPFRSP